MIDSGPESRLPTPCAGILAGLLLSLLLPGPAAAQEGASREALSIVGRAVTADGDPAAGAEIRIRRAGLEAEVDDRGEFRSFGLEPGLYRVQASLPDHAVVVEDAEVMKDGPARVTLRLIPLHRLMEELWVTTRREPEGDRDRGSRTVVRSEALRQGAAANLLQALVGQVPGTRVTGSGGFSGDGGRIRIRGVTSITQSNDPLLFVDGVRVSGANPARVLEGMDPSSVDSLEVLRGPEAMQFGPASAAGVILVHTRRSAGAGVGGDDGGGTNRR